MITIKFKRNNELARAPHKAHDNDAGWDVYATSMSFIPKSVFPLVTYGTGLSFEPPRGVWLMVVPRSSVYKTGLVLSNGVGIIDNGYRGEVKAMFLHVGVGEMYKTGDRIMQLIPMGVKDGEEVVFQEVESLSESPDGRDENGFGSSGRN